MPHPVGCAAAVEATANGNVVEALVLIHVVLRNVEAGGVGEVVDVEGVAQDVLVVDGQFLDQRRVGAPLPGLAEDIALAGR